MIGYYSLTWPDLCGVSFLNGYFSQSIHFRYPWGAPSQTQTVDITGYTGVSTFLCTLKTKEVSVTAFLSTQIFDEIELTEILLQGSE